jgi:hypothetical protein
MFSYAAAIVARTEYRERKGEMFVLREPLYRGIAVPGRHSGTFHSTPE